MSSIEQEAIQGLINSWIPLGVEYADGAEGVSAMYIYAASEPGQRYANIFFEQDGRVVYPDDLSGVDVSSSRVLRMQHHMVADLREVEKRLALQGAGHPTEYRIIYEPGPGKLDVQISREIKYTDHPVKTLQNGPEDWLDGRLEKVFGKLLPPEDEWPKYRRKRKI